MMTSWKISRAWCRGQPQRSRWASRERRAETRLKRWERMARARLAWRRKLADSAAANSMRVLRAMSSKMSLRPIWRRSWLLPGEDGAAGPVLEGEEQFFSRLGGGTVRGEDGDDKDGAGDADEDARGPGHGDEEDLVWVVDGAGGDEAGGVGAKDGGVGAEVGKGVGGDGAAGDGEGEAEDEEFGGLGEEGDEGGAEDGAA